MDIVRIIEEVPEVEEYCWFLVDKKSNSTEDIEKDYQYFPNLAAAEQYCKDKGLIWIREPHMLEFLERSEIDEIYIYFPDGRKELMSDYREQIKASYK